MDSDDSACGQTQPSPHPDVRAATEAIRAALDALARALLGGAPPLLDALRGQRPRPDDLSAALARQSLPLVGAHLPRPLYVLPPQAADSPLARARAGLGLTSLETALLALTLAAETDDLCARLIDVLHDNQGGARSSVALALALLAPGDPRAPDLLDVVAPHAPLRRWGLIRLADAPGAGRAGEMSDEPGALIRRAVTLDPAVLWGLRGARALDPALGSAARVLAPHVASPHAPGMGSDTVLAALLARVEGALGSSREGSRGPGRAGPLVVEGTDAPACLEAAVDAAAHLGRPLLLLDGERLAAPEQGAEPLRRLLVAALLRDWLPCLQRTSALLVPGGPHAADVQRVLADYPHPVLLLDGADVAAEAGSVRVEVPPPRVADRLAQWRRAADAHGIAADDDIVRALAETSGLSAQDIEEAARATAAEAEARRGLARGTDLQRAARLAVRARATDLRLVAPRASWADLVLPEDRLRLLRRLCARVRYRSRVREDWTIGAATLPGVTALFSGAPGTGKSLAAEVIAADLGLDLCKIDLSQTVSKYIGETEKTLGRLFDEAERGGVLLVFDEADALFGKRSAVKDSHDRYANLETSYLLQRLERFSGLAILTSNLGANLDEAFTRRLSMGVDFPLPGPEERLRLWMRALGRAPTGADLNLSLLAERLELSGGEILNVAVAAAYLAAAEGGPIDAARVTEALRGELGKMGRLVEPYLARTAAPAPAALAAPVSSPPPAASPAPLSLPGRPDPSTATARPGDAGRTAETLAEAAETRPAGVRESGRAGGGDSGGERSPGGGPEGGPGPESGRGAMTQPAPTPADPAPADPAPAAPKPASGFRRGNSYATEGVRGPRPPDKRPGS